jgi:hypothetical protein
VKSQSPIWALVLIVAMTLLFILGLTVTVEGDTQPIIIIIMGLMTPIVTTILNLTKSQKTLEVSEATDKKLDDMLDRDVPSRIDHIEEAIRAHQTKTDSRFRTVELALEEILAKVSK